MTQRLPVLLCGMILVGCGAGKNRLGSRTMAVLAGATKVEVFRLDGQEIFFAPQPRPEGEKRVGGYLVTAQGQDQGKEFADRLADILADERTYSDARPTCFRPGVAFCVWKGEEVVDVLLCFQCSNFYCGPPKDPADDNACFKDSPRRPDLVRLAKEAFPDDKEIQALKE